MPANFYSSAIFMLLLITACGSDEKTGQPDMALEIEVIHRSTNIASGAETTITTAVISNQADYASSLSMYSLDAPLEIDFNRNQIVLADMGLRSTGGYGVSVDPDLSFEDEDSAVVAIRFNSPGAGCVTTQALTNPFAFVRVETRKPITITTLDRAIDC